MKNRNTAFVCALLAIVLAVPGLFVLPVAQVEPIAATDMAADPPHNITAFLHTGDTARYFSPQFSVLNYFDTNTPSDSNGTGSSYSGQEQFAMQWYMFPSVASDLSLVGIDAILWITGEVSTGQPNIAGSLEVFEVSEQDLLNLDFNGTSVYLWNIPSKTPLFTYPPSAPVVFSLPFTHTYARNSTIRFVLTINPGTSGGGVGSQYTNVTVFWDSYHLFDSRLILKTQNPMTIDSCETRDFAGRSKNSFVDEGNTTMYFTANVSDPYGGYDISWVNLTVRDQTGSALPGLDKVPMNRVSGSDESAISSFEVAWDYGGMSVGIYAYQVWATDNSGMTSFYYFDQFTFEPYDELTSDTFAIGITYSLAVSVNDSLGLPLPGATVTYEGATSSTNESGWTVMMVFGNGTLSVFWHGVLVYESSVNLTTDTILYVTCSVYYPELLIVDDLSLPLPSASVFFEFPDGERLPVMMSDTDGSIGVIDRVPVGDSTLSVWWRGSLVFDGEVTITANGIHKVSCEVFYMTVHVTDDLGMLIPSSTVTWVQSDTHILIDSMFVDETGAATSRLPSDTYDVQVSWHGSQIGEATEVVLSSSLEITVIGTVCSVNIVALDTRGSPLPDAHVVVRSSSEVIVSKLTNSSGAIRAVLPVGTLSVETYWYGMLVNVTGVVLDGDVNVILTCTVSYLEVTTIRSNGGSLDGVELVVKGAEGNTLGYAVTAGGSATFRLPDQAVTVEGRLACEYMITHVSLTSSASANVAGDTKMDLEFDYPPGAQTTVLFLLGLIGAIAAILAFLVVVLLLRNRNRSTGPKETYRTQESSINAGEVPPPPDPEPVPPAVIAETDVAPRPKTGARKAGNARRKRKD